ncbi:MAG: HDOD domain-containing protein [Pseudomonadota bacterium]
MSTTAPDRKGPVDTESFAFVQLIAKELSSGRIDMPSFPDVAVRVRQVLSDEFVSSAQVVRVVSSEAALAGKLLMIANSAAINPGGARITDIKTAVTRIGLNMVRSATLAFAMEQVRSSGDLKALRGPMTELWERSVLVAAMCYVVAKRCTTVNADTAMLAGLMHCMGRLYILTRAAKFPVLFADKSTYLHIEREWHSAIAKAILENWDMSDDIVGAISNFEDIDREHEGDADLTDVLTVANLLASCRDAPQVLELNMQGVAACASMKLDAAAGQRVLQESADEVASLRSALWA